MNKGFNKAFASLLTGGVLLAAVAVGVKGGNVSAAAPSAPSEYAWNNPVNLTQGGSFYDNTPSIAADQLDHQVTIGWTRTIKSSTDAYITQASNDTLGGGFRHQNMWEGDDQQMGNVRVKSDNAGGKHILFWALERGTAIGVYGYIDANGNSSPTEEVPNTRGANRKNVALAIGPDNSVHALFGRNGTDIAYYHRTPQGVWDITGETVPIRNRPYDISVGVTSQGQVMVAFKDSAPNGVQSDIFTTNRVGSGQWSDLDDVSQTCCTGCPTTSRAYQPSLAPDPFGGMRLVWGDERCDPVSDPPSRDIYYREWIPGSGWNNQPLVRVVRNSGDSYYPAIDVDNSGVAHLTWGDTTSSPVDYYRTFYAYGSGTTFSGVMIPADPYFGTAWQKEPSIEVSPGYVHLAYSSNRNDGAGKESYYQFSTTNSGPPPTATPVPPTATPVAPTATPVPPPCPQNRFKDLCVNGDQSSYDAVITLNDQGVLTGYDTVPPCPNASWVDCFLPGNPITRQQLAKVIALGAMLPANVQGGPHFADVPPNNTFYHFIEYAYNAGVIDGYRCGAANEPCDDKNRSWYRPQNSVTRGQISKVVSQAFGFNEEIQQQSFQDVPVGSAFHVFVERLANRGIISGYQCGGTGEPCGTSNKPYFRPNATVTRRQAAKIVVGAQDAAGVRPANVNADPAAQP